MGKATGFKEYPRTTVGYRDTAERLGGFGEIFAAAKPEQLQIQGARCMDCGVPFCQSADGCPVDNLIPEWNDQVYRGDWSRALERLHQTNNFPEFTGRVCPAPCEGACVLGIIEPAVTIKNIEQAIVDRGFAEGWISVRPPRDRSGASVAIVGSGPAGLAAADQLNRAGHRVTVYERADRIGGLLAYGIPNMKLDKTLIERRVNLLREEGVEFITGVSVGPQEAYPDGHLVALMKESGAKVDHLSARALIDRHDALLLATGATVPRDLPIAGRDLKGIHFAMDYLTRSTRALFAGHDPAVSARDRRVVVIGGGDTGADCIGTALRQGCQNIVNFELLERPPATRADNNPWPEWPLIQRYDYAHLEAQQRFGGDPRSYCLLSKEFLGGADGHVTGIRTVTVDWSRPSDSAPFTEVAGSEQTFACDLVLLALGFLGPEHALSDDVGLAYDKRSNYQAECGSYQCGNSGVFAAGDCRRGQSLVVWAIHEGRGAARAIDKYLGRKQAQAVTS